MYGTPCHLEWQRRHRVAAIRAKRRVFLEALVVLVLIATICWVP